jgi:hypothetical protein
VVNEMFVRHDRDAVFGPRFQGDPCIYEVASLASPDGPAVLRFVRQAPSLPDYPQARLRCTTDRGGTLDETP